MQRTIKSRTSRSSTTAAHSVADLVPLVDHSSKILSGVIWEPYTTTASKSSTASIRHFLWSGAILMKPVTMFVLFACLLFA
jgi:hypothetical protein